MRSGVIASSILALVASLPKAHAAGPQSPAPIRAELEWRADGIETFRLSAPDEGRLIHMDPRQWDLAPFYYEEFKTRPCHLSAWVEALGDRWLIVNGGQYETDFAYIGTLRRQGHPIGRSRPTHWKGHLVSGGPPHRPFQIVDRLFQPELARRPPGLHSAQTLMLLDRKGRPRVQDTGIPDRRVAVIEDRQGHPWLLFMESPISLRELALRVKNTVAPFRARVALNFRWRLDCYAQVAKP